MSLKILEDELARPVNRDVSKINVFMNNVDATILDVAMVQVEPHPLLL